MNPLEGITPDIGGWALAPTLVVAVGLAGFGLLVFRSRRRGSIGVLNQIRNTLSGAHGNAPDGVAATAPGKNPDLAVWNGLDSGPIQIESNPFGTVVGSIPLPVAGRRARRKAAVAALTAAGHTPLGPPLVIVRPAVYAVPIAAPNRR